MSQPARRGLPDYLFDSGRLVFLHEYSVFHVVLDGVGEFVDQIQ
ncbi:MAG: hypothetical protein ABSA92_16700 [Candidatus Bathyarchaeia archaeon]|jgi:hypothetical protein